MRSTHWTGTVPDRSGPAGYTHLIRAPDDPEENRDGRDPVAWRELAELDPQRAEALILGALEDGGPLTFNGLAVRAVNRTADVVLDTPLDGALWRLLGRGMIERTTRAPIRWRLAPGVEAPGWETPQADLFTETEE